MSIEGTTTNIPPADAHVPSRPQRAWIARVLTVVAILVLALIALGAYLWYFQQPHHSEPTANPVPVEASGDEVLDAIRRGIEFLKVYQEQDGGFSIGVLDPKPAITALVVEALAKSPVPYTESDHEFMRRAAQAIVSKQREDGSICTPGLSLDVYSTSISMLALKALQNPAYAEALERAKKWMLAVQRPVEDGNPQSGGVGYGSGGDVNGVTTDKWVEALKANGVEKDSAAFKNAQLFFSRLQSNPETNNLPAPGTAVGDDGGFFYRPGGGGSDKPFEKARDGRKIPKSYGLMSYAGLKSFLYMDVDKNDPRVVSAWRWVRDNYTLEENRHLGKDGLFYYYLTMAKALAAYGESVIETSEGHRHVWARELEEKLLSLQKGNGSWRNDSSDKWKEDDAVMVTAFAIRTLAICREFLQNNLGGRALLDKGQK